MFCGPNFRPAREENWKTKKNWLASDKDLRYCSLFMGNEYNDEDDFRPRVYRGPTLDDLESRIQELETHRPAGSATGISIGYALGMSIAVVLSWSRNASILWCILHGFFSWGYVIYFAWTR